MPTTSSIDVQLRLRNARKFKREVAESAASLESLGFKGATAMARFSAQSEKLKTFGRSMTEKVTLPTLAIGGAALYAAKEWESAFTGVRKTVDTDAAGYARLEQGLRSMSLQIPTSANDLAAIAESAGALGIKEKNILSFTRVIADLGETTNLVGEEGASTLARFANITGMSQSQFSRLGSTIVDLGNKGASTEAEIAAMGLRIAAAGTYVGMSEPQILGWANALSSLGIEAEAGGTSISTAFKEINSAVAGGGQKLNQFAEVAGMSGKDFAAAWKADASSATVSFIEGLDRMKKAGEDVPALLKSLDPQLGGTRVQNALMAAAGGKGLVKSLQDGSKAWEENTALSEEAEKRYRTFAARLNILKNTVTDLGVTLGNVLLPPLTRFVRWLAPKLADAARWFRDLSDGQQRMLLVSVGLAAALGPVMWTLGALAGGVGKFLVVAAKLAKVLAYVRTAFQLLGAQGAIAALLNPVGLTVVAIAALGVAFFVAYKKIDSFREIVDKAFAGIKTAIVPALSDVKDGLGDLSTSAKILWSAFNGDGPSGIVKVASILKAVFGVVLTNVVETVKRQFAGLAQSFRGLGQIFKGVSGLIKSILTGDFKGMWRNIKLIFGGAINVIVGQVRAITAPFRQVAVTVAGLFGKAWGAIKSGAFSAIGGVKNGFNALVGFFKSLPGRVASAASGLFNGVKEAYRSAINWIISKWNGLELRIDPGKIAIPGAPDIDLPGFTLGTPDLPLLAAGGAATTPGWSVVGENGPELKYLPKGAGVVPLDHPTARKALGSGDDERPIHTHVYLKGREIAKAVSREVSDAKARK